ncbi:MAG: hypothetical protein U0263_38100 [Polyangiaceae bacterium]
MWVLEPALRYFAAGLAVWALVLLARTKDVSHQRPSELAPTLHRDPPAAGRPLDLESLLGAVPPAPTLRHSPEPAPTINRPQPTQLRVDAAGAADAHAPREVPALATLPTYLAPLEGCPGWTERRIPVAGDGPWSLRGAAGSEGPVLACAPAGVPTDIKLLAWRLGSDGSAQPLEGQVSASRDMAMAGGDTIEVVTAAPARGECVLRCLQLSPHRAEQRIDSVPGVMTGISMARANDLRWVAYLRSNLRDNDEQLFVACRKDSVVSTGSWRVFPVGEPGRRGTQTSIAALPGGRAAVVTQRRPAGWGGGGAIHIAAASGPGGLDAALSAASAKSITVELVDATGRVQEELVDATDNFHTSGVAIDDRGRLAVATFHCDDPPEGTRFRIRLATREADGWAAEDDLGRHRAEERRSI